MVYIGTVSRIPWGEPLVDEAIIQKSKQTLKDQSIRLVEHDVVVASKEEVRAALRRMKADDRVDAVILFSGTWVWAAHLIAAVRDFAMTGKGVVLWKRARAPAGTMPVYPPQTTSELVCPVARSLQRIQWAI
jgi:hypothetical protein